MEIKEYLRLIGLSHRKFCKETGISPPVFSLYLHGKRRLLYKHAKRIEEWSKMKCTVHEIMAYSDKFDLK